MYKYIFQTCFCARSASLPQVKTYLSKLCQLQSFKSLWAEFKIKVKNYLRCLRSLSFFSPSIDAHNIFQILVRLLVSSVSVLCLIHGSPKSDDSAATFHQVNWPQPLSIMCVCVRNDILQTRFSFSDPLNLWRRFKVISFCGCFVENNMFFFPSRPLVDPSLF